MAEYQGEQEYAATHDATYQQHEGAPAPVQETDGQDQQGQQPSALAGEASFAPKDDAPG